MERLNEKMRTLSDKLAEGSKEKVRLLEKVKKYRAECGCSLGAKFMLVSVLLFIYWLIVSGDRGAIGLVKVSLEGLLFFFFSGVAGKLLGIGIARMRLRMLFKSLEKNRDN